MTEEFKRYVPTLIYFGKRFIIFFPIFLICLAAYTLAAVFTWFTPWILLPLPALAVPAIFAFRATKQLITPIWLIRKVRRHDDEIRDHGRVITYDGPPETGKTLSMTYDAMIRRDEAWDELKFEKLCAEGFLSNPDYEFETSDAAWHYLSVKQTVDYCDAQDAIPLLMSNYAIEKDGQFSSKLKLEHLLQQERAPEGGVFAYDESADIISNTRSSATKHGVINKEDKEELARQNKILADTFSKERHYGNWRISLAEQDGNENFIAARRVVALTRSLISLEKVCEPERLMRKLDKLRYKILNNDIATEAQAAAAAELRARIAKIGFIKVTYFDNGRGGKINNYGVTDFYMPKNTGFKYAARAYEFEYKALQMPLDLEPHESAYQVPPARILPPLTDCPLFKAPKATQEEKRKVRRQLLDKYRPQINKRRREIKKEKERIRQSLRARYAQQIAARKAQPKQDAAAPPEQNRKAG